jgi:hypothetical protein
VTLICNSNYAVCVNQTNLRLIGLADLWSGNFDPQAAFSGTSPADEFTIVLSHNPDTVCRLLPFSWEILLAGHTDGGKVVLPWIGAPWTPVEDIKWRRGFFDLGTVQK